MVKDMNGLHARKLMDFAGMAVADFNSHFWESKLSDAHMSLHIRNGIRPHLHPLPSLTLYGVNFLWLRLRARNNNNEASQTK